MLAFDTGSKRLREVIEIDEDRLFRSSDCGDVQYDGGAGRGGVDGEMSLSTGIFPLQTGIF